MKIIISGGRDFKDSGLVERVIKSLRPNQIVVGDCPTGVDAFVQSAYANRGDFPCVLQVYKADWEKFDRAAGPLRNRAMVNENLDSVLITFPGGRGTANCVLEAHKVGMLVLKVDE